MAIDPKELRIGSHINVKGVRVVVDEITNTTLVAYVTPDNDWEATDPTEDWIESIPITPELLTELGFKYHEYDNGKLWEMSFPDLYKAYLYLELDESTTSTYNFHMWNMKEYEVNGRVQFLHELENWIYLMYGKELITN